MPQPNEISSTEKLLDVIRKKEDSATGPSPKVSTPPPAGKRQKSPPAKVISLQKYLTIGVDIGHEYLRLVKIKKSSEKKWELLDYKSIPFLPGTSKGTAGFATFLQSELNTFCGLVKGLDIWVNMSAAQVDVRHIRIPKVTKKQIENAVYWTFKKETAFDEKESIFDFEVHGEVVEQGIPKLAVMAYTAPKSEVEEVKDLFTGIGLPVTGISITPFAVQNIFRTEWIPTLQGTVASLFIGNDFSRIDIFSRGNIVMTRGIKAGTNSMVETLMEALNEKSATPIGIGEARKMLFSMSPDSPPLTEKDVGFGLPKEDIFEIVSPALERLVRQAERTFEYYTATLGNEKVEKIYVSGAMNIYMPIVKYVGDQLGMENDILDPLNPQIPYLGSTLKTVSVSERVAFIPALGLALSDKAYTPNLIFTHKDKEKETSIARINRMIFVVFILAVCVCSGILITQMYATSQKKATIATLQKQLSQYHPRIDQQVVMQVLARGKEQQQLSKAYSQRYLGMAVIGELSALTPSNIRLTSLKMNLGGMMPDTPKGPPTTPPPQGGASLVGEGITIEGVVLGDRKELDASLAGYVSKLGASPMFRETNVQSSTVKPLKKGEVLQFTLIIKIG